MRASRLTWTSVQESENCVGLVWRIYACDGLRADGLWIQRLGFCEAGGVVDVAVRWKWIRELELGVSLRLGVGVMKRRLGRWT